MGKTPVSLQDRIYYVGDMANSEGFGTVTEIRPPTPYGGEQAILTLDDGRKILVPTDMIADRYEGHGGVRFVTEQAYNDHRERQIESMRQMHAKLAANRTEKFVAWLEGEIETLNSSGHTEQLVVAEHLHTLLGNIESDSDFADPELYHTSLRELARISDSIANQIDDRAWKG